jgi:hypothetical protein
MADFDPQLSQVIWGRRRAGSFSTALSQRLKRQATKNLRPREPGWQGLEEVIVPGLPVDPERELNDPRFVELPAQILQSGRGVGIDIVGVVEGVKEIRREPDVGYFL